MAHEKVRALIAFLTIFAVVGGVSWAVVNAQQILPQETQNQEQNQPETPPEVTLQADTRNKIMAYIGANHSETLQFMSDLNWTGGRVTPENLLGAEIYTYQAQGWTVTIHYPVVLDPVYDVTVDYSTASGTIGIPYHITWEGTWQNGCVTEVSYVFAQ
ncbi:MAG: hypothetical protein NWF00_08345 [Candidatus Bathyarchaeota archaeon]|nr:hypothetical protein [Candidatus Bathyarchaeota archaeon]